MQANAADVLGELDALPGHLTGITGARSFASFGPRTGRMLILENLKTARTCGARLITTERTQRHRAAFSSPSAQQLKPEAQRLQRPLSAAADIPPQMLPPLCAKSGCESIAANQLFRGRDANCRQWPRNTHYQADAYSLLGPDLHRLDCTSFAAGALTRACPGKSVSAEKNHICKGFLPLLPGE
jgi:hypothetical protein